MKRIAWDWVHCSGFWVPEWTGFNNAVKSLLAMERACADPPSVRTSSDSPLHSWAWRAALASLERGAGSVFWCRGMRLFCVLQKLLAFARKQKFLVWIQPFYSKSVPCWMVCSAASPEQCNTNRCANFSIQCTEVLVANGSLGDLNCLMCIRQWMRFKINHEEVVNTVLLELSALMSPLAIGSEDLGRMGLGVSHYIYQCF